MRWRDICNQYSFWDDSTLPDKQPTSFQTQRQHNHHAPFHFLLSLFRTISNLRNTTNAFSTWQRPPHQQARTAPTRKHTRTRNHAFQWFYCRSGKGCGKPATNAPEKARTFTTIHLQTKSSPGGAEDEHPTHGGGRILSCRSREAR
jgi:hypothetical protein